MFKSSKVIIYTIILICISFNSYADQDHQDQYCNGFKEGYKTILGNNVMVPYCPYAPYTPYGSTDFREGLKAGMIAAQRDYNRRH